MLFCYILRLVLLMALYETRGNCDLTVWLTDWQNGMELAMLVTGEGHIAKLPFQFRVKTEYH